MTLRDELLCIAQAILHEPSQAELESFRLLQAEFDEPKWLAHHDPTRQLYIDTDGSKETGHGATIYHTKPGFTHKDVSKPPPTTEVQPIMFLSRLLTDAEKNYWPTELEVSALCWTLRKVRHLVEACPTDLPAIIYTDHSSTTGIAKATSLSSISLERQNLRLVRASQFIQQFRLRIFHRPGKTNKIADAFSRLPYTDPTLPRTQDDLEDIPAPYVFEQPTAYLLTASVLQLSDDTRGQSVDRQQDPQVEKLPYYLEDSLVIFINSNSEESLCLPRSMTREIFNLVHNEQMHQGFDRAWQKLRSITFYKGTKLLKQYIEHCPPILTPAVPFYTITLDLIVAMPVSADRYNTTMTITDKFTKLIGMIPGCANWDSEDWALGTLSFW
ncbi:hypothetical protein N7501_000661 [Penicillium viridicatum]|nr:hypothetical protein N7501_000661 [Penicillium viridicatum]